MTCTVDLTGMQIDADFGQLDCHADQFDANVVLALLRSGHWQGKVVYVVRGAISENDCAAFHANFRSLLATHGSLRTPDSYIDADQVGSTQFLKSGQAYAESTVAAQTHVLSLFDGFSADRASHFMLDDRLLPGLLRRGVHFGPARFKSTYANHCTVRAWGDNGEMALQPHEDTSQIEAARIDGFEIQGVRVTVSFNVCVAYSGSGGELLVWNIRPSPALRRSLGLYDTGYPYALDLVRDVPRLSIELEPGDCYFLSSSFLHAVRPTVGERVTAGRFLGECQQDRVVFWT